WYTQSSVKNPGHSSNRSSSIQCTYAWSSSSMASRNSLFCMSPSSMLRSVESHKLTIILPEPTDGRFCHQVVLTGHVPSTELDKRAGMFVTPNSLLHEFNCMTVL